MLTGLAEVIVVSYRSEVLFTSLLVLAEVADVSCWGRRWILLKSSICLIEVVGGSCGIRRCVLLKPLMDLAEVVDVSR